MKGQFQIGIFKNKHLQVVMFQNVLVDLKISKKKQISLFFSMSFGIFVSFQKKIESLCFSNFINMFTCNIIQM
jgi:hypothetical protein